MSDTEEPRRLSTCDEDTLLFFRDPAEAEHQKMIGTTEQIYRYVKDDKLYKKSSILKVYDASVICDVLAPANPNWIEFRDPPASEAKEEDEEEEVLFFRDPNEKANQKLLKTDEKIYRYVVDDKLYKEGSILRAGHSKAAISDEVAPQLPNWVEFRAPAPAPAEEENQVLFFRDPNEKANQKLLKTDEKIYRYVVDDKLYKEGSILRAGHSKAAISDVVAPQLPNWVEFRAPAPVDAAEEAEKVVFFRDPDEKAHQKLLKTTEKIYRYVVDDKLYKEGSILRAGHSKAAISDEVAPRLPNWVEFRAPAPESEEAGKPLFFRDPNEAENQKLLNTTENIYRYSVDDKLYKKGSILRAGHPESAMSDEVAPKLPTWVEFRAALK